MAFRLCSRHMTQINEGKKPGHGTDDPFLCSSTKKNPTSTPSHASGQIRLHFSRTTHHTHDFLRAAFLSMQVTLLCTRRILSAKRHPSKIAKSYDNGCSCGLVDTEITLSIVDPGFDSVDKLFSSCPCLSRMRDFNRSRHVLSNSLFQI